MCAAAVDLVSGVDAVVGPDRFWVRTLAKWQWLLLGARLLEAEPTDELADRLLRDAEARGDGVAFGNLDGDGDLDLFAPNYDQQSHVYTNLTRQLSWRGVPRVGKPLDLDLRGPAGGPWLLGAALASVSLSVPPFGTLRLDPASRPPRDAAIVLRGAAHRRGHTIRMQIQIQRPFCYACGRRRHSGQIVLVPASMAPDAAARATASPARGRCC